MSLPDVIKAALDQIQFLAKTETVIGEPISAGNVTLIPVSKISIGFAAGGAGQDGKPASGAGTGGGVNIVPVAFIAITGDRVQVHRISPLTPDLGTLLALAPDLVKKVREFMGKKNSSHDAARPADSSSHG